MSADDLSRLATGDVVAIRGRGESTRMRQLLSDSGIIRRIERRTEGSHGVDPLTPECRKKLSVHAGAHLSLRDRNRADLSSDKER